MIITLDQINAMDRHERIRLINSLSGPRTAYLLGTANNEGQTNLAIFNSVMHIGANPPLIGFIMRPVVVERHSFENIVDQKYFTLNLVTEDIIDKAHCTAGKFKRSESEFDACGFTPQYIEGFEAPFVKEAAIQFAMQCVEILPIKSNNTKLIVSQIQFIQLGSSILEQDGHINHDTANTVSVAGLESYYSNKLIRRFPFKALKKD